MSARPRTCDRCRDELRDDETRLCAWCQAEEDAAHRWEDGDGHQDRTRAAVAGVREGEARAENASPGSSH